MEQIEDILDDEVIESSYGVYHHYVAKWQGRLFSNVTWITDEDFKDLILIFSRSTIRVIHQNLSPSLLGELKDQYYSFQVYSRTGLRGQDRFLFASEIRIPICFKSRLLFLIKLAS